MKRNQDVAMVAGDSRRLIFNIFGGNEDDGGDSGDEDAPTNLLGKGVRFEIEATRRDAPVVELTEDDDRVTVGGGDGIVTIEIDGAISSSLPRNGRHYLRIIDEAGESYTVATGSFTLTR